jgi:hypothetical protein
MGGDGRRWARMVGDGRRWAEMGGDGRRWSEMVGDGRRWAEMVGDGRRWAEMGGDGRGWSTAVGLLKNWKSSPRRKQRPVQHPAPRPLPPNPAPLTTPRGGPVACRALRRVRDHIHAYMYMSRARAAAFPHGARAVALGAVLRGWGLGASKSVRAGGSSADRNEGAVACGVVCSACVAGWWRVRVAPCLCATAKAHAAAPIRTAPYLAAAAPPPRWATCEEAIGLVGAVRAGNGVATPLHRIALGCSTHRKKI